VKNSGQGSHKRTLLDEFGEFWDDVKVKFKDDGDSCLFARYSDWDWPFFPHEDLFFGTIELWRKYRDIEDDRLLTLVGALCVESALDKLLGALLPGYASLSGEGNRGRGISMSLKIRIIRALAIIPAKFLDCCDLVTSIRNEFAHNLALSKFSDLPLKVANKTMPYFKRISRLEADCSWTERRLYGLLLRHILYALFICTIRARELTLYIAEDDFLTDFRKHMLWIGEQPLDSR